MKKIKEFLKKYGRVLTFFSLIFIMFYCINMYGNSLNPVEKPEQIEYWTFEQMVSDGNVKKVEYGIDNAYIGVYDNEGKTYITGNPRTEDFKKWLYDNKITVVEVTESYDVVAGIFDILKLVVIYGFLFYMLSRMMPGQKKEKRLVETPKVTFDDIAGYEETKKNMEFLVEFLKDDSKIKKIGARIPKGVVLYGPPGTGKTLLAKAIAGTAGVPFFNATGSDFVEMYVGLGASRIRSLFADAKKAAPCIVFIDEIDAVGGKRGQGHSEKDQTINALLAELDGFSGSEGIVTICATNRIEELDSALIRPGRFDRQIAIPLPDKKDRYKILEVHAKGKKLDETVDFDNLANITVGFSGASLESLLNEAAIIAVSENSESISASNIDQAFFKIVMKGEKKEHDKNNNKDIEIAAHHEAGHALAIKLLTDDEVPKVTIIGSTSGAGGVTFRTPTEKGFLSKSDMENFIKTLYAGRAAEKIYFGNDEDITIGASNDIQQATRIIRQYLTLYGMSNKMGLINIDEFRGENEIQTGAIGTDTLLQEATELSKRLFNDVFDLLQKNKKLLMVISSTLIEKESLTDFDLTNIIKEYKKEEES